MPGRSIPSTSPRSIVNSDGVTVVITSAFGSTTKFVPAIKSPKVGKEVATEFPVKVPYEPIRKVEKAVVRKEKEELEREKRVKEVEEARKVYLCFSTFYF